MPKIKNRARMRKRMLALAPSIKAQIRPAMEQGADEITALQRGIVRERTGRTEHSIGWVWGDVNSGARSKTPPDNSVNDMKITIFAADNAAFYGRFEEFGTVKMTARPFFFGPYRSLRQRVKQRMATATGKALKAAALIT